MRAILHTLKTGGSGTGLSYWSAWAKCGKAASLAASMPEERIPSGPLGIGTIFHAFMELYYGKYAKKEFDSSIVKFSDVADEADRIEAERLFRFYRLQHQPDEFGKVVELETVRAIKFHVGRQNKVLDDVSKIPQPAAYVPHEYLEYTIKPDLVVQPGRQEVKMLDKQRNIQCTPGNVYLVDHKTEGQWDGSAVDRHVNSMQFTLYQYVWNQLFPNNKCSGLIVNIILKYKNPEVKTLLIPFPSDSQIKAALGFLRHCKEMRDSFGARANPLAENCFPKGRVCSWFANGMCDRY